MLIEAPCRLGERFTHHRKIGISPRNPMLVGVDLFLWHCSIDGVLLVGADRPGASAYFFERADLDIRPIAIQVPDSWVEGNCGPEELGMDPGKRWKLNGIRLCGERGWGFRLVDKNGSSCLVRTEVLGKLFAPVLPLVQVDLMDFL